MYMPKNGSIYDEILVLTFLFDFYYTEVLMDPY